MKIVVKILTNEEVYNLLPWIARSVLESLQTQRQDGNHSDVVGSLEELPEVAEGDCSGSDARNTV